MARRRQNDDFLSIFYQLAALLPWWVGVILAVVSYIVLHQYSEMRSADTGAATLETVVVPQMLAAVAKILQYVIPSLLLAGSFVSGLRCLRNRQLLGGVASGRRAIGELSWLQFEQLIGEHFRQKGYSVVESGGGGPDGGVDLRLRKNGERYLVQCKHWKAGAVPVSVVRELLGSIAAEGANGGFVVASEGFTSSANTFARQNNISLIDGRQLKKILQMHDAKETHGSLPPRTNASPITCGRCGSRLVQRTAQKGRHAGAQFLGCSNFPKCRYTKALSD